MHEDSKGTAIRSLSSFLYGPVEGPLFAERLLALMREREGALRTAPVRSALTEKDALLITYGDMISAPSGSASDPPLRRLGRFLRSRAVVRPRTHPLLTSFRRADGSTAHVWTTFSADQVDFDFANPEVLLEFIDIFLLYAEKGARLIRLDAIAYLWKEDGTPCIHHPKTHAVVKLLRAVVDALGLDLFLLTETNVPHEANVSYFGNGDEAHLVYNFALPPLVLHAAVSGDAGPLRSWAASLPPPGAGRTASVLSI